MRYSVGIDIGATKILAGLVREDGTVVHRVRRTTPFDSRDGVVETTCEMVREVVLFGQTQDCCPAGIGVGTAGQVNFAEGIVVSGTPNIRDWTGVKLGELLSASANLPVWVDNDVNAHLLAEVSIGVAAGRQNVLMLALGTGVGGAACNESGIVRGTWGGACEFGHISVDFQGPACNCGSRGCLELYASGTGIARMMRQRLGIDATDDSRWIDAPSVFEAARAGDASARAVIADMIGALSTACISLIHTFNPQMIVLGGGVMEQGPWLFESLRKRIGQQGMPSLVGATEVVCAKFGADAGLIGAALQPFVYQCGWMRSEGHDD